MYLTTEAPRPAGAVVLGIFQQADETLRELQIDTELGDYESSRSQFDKDCLFPRAREHRAQCHETSRYIAGLSLNCW